MPAFGATITDSGLDSSQKMLILSTKGYLSGVKIKKVIMEKPHRVIFDIENMVLPDTKAKIEPRNELLSSVKIAQYTENSVRIVFAGESSFVDDIKISTIKNLIIFNFGEVVKTFSGSVIYQDKEPPPKAVDYFSFYENLNVIQSKDLNKKSCITPCVLKRPVVKPVYDTVAGWHPISVIDLPAKYNIFNIEAFDKGIKLQGLGSVSVTSPVITTSKFSIDLPESIFQGGKTPLPVQLSSTEKVSFSVPSKNIIRLSVDTKTPKDYSAIISPDAMTISVQKTKNLSTIDFPSVVSTGLEDFSAQSQGKQVTKIVIRGKNPLVHSLIKTSELIDLNFYNLNTTAGFMKNIVPTRQFRSLTIEPLLNNKCGTHWKIPVKKSTLVSTNLSSDGRTLEIYLKDEMYKGQDIVVKSGSTVMIDAGHGGVDVGAMRDGICEKDINLDVAEELKKYLESKGVKVIMTRASDVKIPLPDRTFMANDAKCDVFVSVHVNSARNTDVSGIETHWYKPNSRTFAKIVHNNVTLGLDSYDRGIFQSQFYVINHTVMPAVLVEIGFISNCHDRCDMIKEQRKIATAKYIGNGILLYLAMDYDNEVKAKANAK